MRSFHDLSTPVRLLGGGRTVDEADFFDPDGWMAEMRAHPDRPVVPRGRPRPTLAPWNGERPLARTGAFGTRLWRAWLVLIGETAT